MLQNVDEIGLDFVDPSDDFVRNIEIPLFMEKSIKEFQGRQPENIFRGFGHHPPYPHTIVTVCE